ncbi:hypothetical protein HHL17_16000 [Chitinophaga sp. G-6-1-13]|uniref:Gp5/Type VI secretion system Vgr protein OB-fold domain-containing protein n=1 Tax=Chitinophaga fulva TaxID=2728842 RepID=A0A848GNZ7_9BACT|nr:phage baseplate assembly protein V [Chitinophaga fulva]NML38712.1 hypothetical protein [Chitinophaga fulva]
MAQLTDTMFSIDGNPVLQFTSFALNQSIFDHHQFTLICPAQAIDGLSGIFSSSRDMIGSTFGAHISGVGLKGDLTFNGIVTSVETSRVNGQYGEIIISGYSPTIVLDNGPHCKTWEQKTLRDIAQDVLRFFPQNQLSPKVQPLAKESYDYMVQYKETAWAFLQRISAENGEWLFWDGRNLVLGPPTGDAKTSLVYGSTLSHFNINLNARPTRTQYMGWDYQNSELYTSVPQAENVGQKAGLNSLGEKVHEKAQTIFSTQPKQWNFRYTGSKKQQDEMATLHSAMEGSKMVRLTGHSGHPGVAIGARTEIVSNNVFNGSTEGYGEYIVTNISHFVDTKGDYRNEFTAVPSSIHLPPVSIPQAPVCETQSAIVTDNHDPKGIGRIRVKFHWMNGEEKTPWVRIASPHGGGGKGHFFVPEIDEEVIVGFENDSAVKPYIIGTVYHGSANTSFSNAENDIKTIQTRSGNKIIYNDGNNSMIVQDASGNTVTMDGNGSIIIDASSANVTINAPKTMNLRSTDMNIVVDNRLHMTVGNMLQMDVGNQMMINAMAQMLVNTPEMKQMVSKYLHLQATKALIHTPKGEMKIEAEDFYIAGQKKLFLHSDETATLNSKGTAEMKGQQGNKHSNSPMQYEAATPEIQSKCIVYFRPKNGWAGEDFGFDWYRSTDTGRDGDIKYDEHIGKHYQDAAFTTLLTNLNDYSANFKKDDVMIRSLKSNEYYAHKIVWKPQKDAAGAEVKDASGATIYEQYFGAWLSLYPAQKTTPPPAAAAAGAPASTPPAPVSTGYTNTKATLSLYVEIEEEPDLLRFEDNSHFTITPKETNVKGKGKGLHKLNDAITIECLTEFATDQTIIVNAVTKNPDGTETVKKAGFVKVMANNSAKRRKKKIVLVKVATPPMSTAVAQTGSTSGQKDLFAKYLKQALINVEVVEETLNVTADPGFQSGGNYNNSGQIVAYYIGSGAPSGFVTLENHLYSKLKDQLKAANPADERKYDGYFRAYYMGEGGGYMQGGTLNGLNGYSIGSSVMLFPTKNDQTAAHEFLHSLNLPHTFSNPGSSPNAKYTYQYKLTENLMDYSHQASPAIVRSALWHWQWVIANAKADPE